METIGTSEENINLSDPQKRVAQGEKITITEHGVPVAVVLSPNPQLKQNRHEVVQSLREFRARHFLGDVSLRSLIEEGRDQASDLFGGVVVQPN